jgi:hypothetical protein
LHISYPFAVAFHQWGHCPCHWLSRLASLSQLPPTSG